MTQKSVDKLIEELNKKYMPDGATVPVVARSDDRPHQNFIPCTSPALGFVLGNGGWSEGHLHEFFGKEHAGKTTLRQSIDSIEYVMNINLSTIV